MSFSGNSLKKARKIQEDSSIYEDLTSIPTTSNCCERLFSKSKVTIGFRRKSKTPINFKMILL
jgi:hypothetical protein